MDRHAISTHLEGGTVPAEELRSAVAVVRPGCNTARRFTSICQFTVRLLRQRRASRRTSWLLMTGS